MKKIKSIMLILLISITFGIYKVRAFSINAKTSVYVNSSVAVKIDARGLIGRFDILSSDQSILAGSDSKWIEDGTITVYFSALKVGSATISVNANDVSDASGNEFKGSRSIKINVVKKNNSTINVNPNYSKNNYLKSLEVEGYQITPDFNKDTLEYTVTLTPGTEKINIKAQAEDNKANIKGIGEVSVNEGANTINITVIAENGNEKVYKIIATNEEKDPIIVNINSNEYTVIKKSEILGSIDGYKNSIVDINGFSIPTLFNEITKVNLVGLKDKDGNIKLFSYDSKTGKYREYIEISFNKMNLYIKENNKSKYKKVKIKVNDIEIVAYKIDGIDDYYLLYGTNTLTGNTGYYLYDTEENSIQRYNTILLEKVTKEKDKYLSLVIVLSCVCFLSMLFLLIEINRYNKKVR